MNDNTAGAIPLDKLARLINKLSPAQIIRVPLQRLPADLPVEWINEFPNDRAKALYQLRARLLDPQARAREVAAEQARIDSALSWLRRPSALLRWLEELGQSIAATEQSFLRWREQNERFTSSGSWRSSEALESEITMESNEGMEFSALTIRCDHLEKSLIAQHPNVAKYTRLVTALDKRAKRGALPRTAIDTLSDAHAALMRLQDYVSRIRMLRLYVVHNEMLALRNQIVKITDRKLRLDENIVHLSAEIKRANTWTRKLSRKRNPQHIAHLRELMEAMQIEKAQRRIEVSDVALDRWINALVDATVDSHCQAMARSRIDAARALLVSLIKYRRRTASALARVESNADESALHEITQDLQKLLRTIFDSIKPDVLLEFREQQGIFHARLQQLQNQLVSEFLATTSPRYMIKT